MEKIKILVVAALVTLCAILLVSGNSVLTETHRRQVENGALKGQVEKLEGELADARRILTVVIEENEAWQEAAALVYESRWPENPGSAGVHFPGPLLSALDTSSFKPEQLRLWLNPCRNPVDSAVVETEECLDAVAKANHYRAGNVPFKIVLAR